MNVCALCHEDVLECVGDDGFSKVGELKCFDKMRGMWTITQQQSEGTIWLHEGCLLWSSDLNCQKESALKLILANPSKAVETVMQCLENTCISCGRSAASISCDETFMSFIHLPCAIREKFKFFDAEFEDQRRLVGLPESISCELNSPRVCFDIESETNLSGLDPAVNKEPTETRQKNSKKSPYRSLVFNSVPNFGDDWEKTSQIKSGPATQASFPVDWGSTPRGAGCFASPQIDTSVSPEMIKSSYMDCLLHDTRRSNPEANARNDILHPALDPVRGDDCKTWTQEEQECMERRAQQVPQGSECVHKEPLE